MSYNLGYTSLPTFNNNSIGYFFPGSIITQQQFNLSGGENNDVVIFNNVPPGIYIFCMRTYAQQRYC